MTKINKRKILISVVGSRKNGSKTDKLAYKVGKMVAETGAVLLCGGLAGVMHAAAQGAQEAGGLTIGLLPGCDKKAANPYIDIPITTSIGFARNAIVACAADIIVALPGSYGTNSEICYGLVYKRPVIDLGGWKIKGMIKVKNFKEAEKILKKLVQKIPNPKLSCPT